MNGLLVSVSLKLTPVPVRQVTLVKEAVILLVTVLWYGAIET